MERYKYVDTLRLDAFNVEFNGLQHQLIEREKSVSLDIVSYLKGFLTEIYQNASDVCNYEVHPYIVLALIFDLRYNSMKCLFMVLCKD